MKLLWRKNQTHQIRATDEALAKHPSVGGETWSADLELGAKVHQLIGQYWTQIAGASTGDRFRLLVELAGNLYDLHALKRIALVRPGHVEDASAFDTEHAIRASLAVWQPLTSFPVEDAERQAIDRALAACRSRWMGEALRKVSGTANTGKADRDPAPRPCRRRASGFVERCGEPQPEHCLFPFGSPQPTDPEKPVTDISSGWDLVRSLSGVSCRLHDLRHTFCTRLAEAGVPESTMLALMGHISRAMLERYSHIRMAAKREALAAITLRPVIENSEGVPVKVPVAAPPSQIQWPATC